MSLIGRFRLASRAALIGRARDHTGPARIKTSLILAPHPDDETLGCGGRILLARGTATAVTVVVATDGAASRGEGKAREDLQRVRSAELAEATGLLGVAPQHVIELGYPDGELSRHIAALTADLVRLITERRPDEVYSTSIWETHPDHVAAAVALRQALDQLSDPTVAPPRLFEYPIWLWSEWPISRRRLVSGPVNWLRMVIRRESHTIDLGDLRSAKQAAIDAYGSQLGGVVNGVTVGLPSDVLRRAADGPELYFDIRR